MKAHLLAVIEDSFVDRDHHHLPAVVVASGGKVSLCKSGQKEREGKRGREASAIPRGEPQWPIAGEVFREDGEHALH